jgi:WD40 repeat protein/CHAT domain-containing protein
VSYNFYRDFDLDVFTLQEPDILNKEQALWVNLPRLSDAANRSTFKQNDETQQRKLPSLRKKFNKILIPFLWLKEKVAKQNATTLTIIIKEEEDNFTIEAIGSKGVRVPPRPAPQLEALLFNQHITDTLKELTSQTASVTSDAIQKLGKDLYNALFSDRDIFCAFGKEQGSFGNVSLRLQIEPAELAVLPWETLHDGNDWLSAQSTAPLVRKLALSNNRKPLQMLKIKGALRILFVGASPKGLEPLNIEVIADGLETLLVNSINYKQIVFDKLLNATLEDLQQTLLKEYHIVYFAGHGSPEGIFLDDGQGEALKKDGKEIGRGYKSLVSAETFSQALTGKQTRLVYLAACNTSKTTEGNLLLKGFAKGLARSNLPAIVAMQYPINDRQANPLTTQFFAALAAGRPVDTAMAEARAVMIKKGHLNRDVFSPVLFLQTDNGALFQKAKSWPLIILSLMALIIATVYLYQTNRAIDLKSADDLGKSALSSLTQGNELDAFVMAIKAGRTLQKYEVNHPDVTKTLQNALNQGGEYNRLEGHKGVVYSVRFSPNGKLLASGSGDGTIKLWDGKTGILRHTLMGHSGGVTSVSFSPNGKTLASGSGDMTIKLWDVKTGTVIHTLSGHTAGVTSVSYSPDGKTLASGSGDQTIKVWDIKTGTVIHTFSGHTSDVNSVSYSPDGRTLASGSGDKTIKLWDVDEGTEIHTLSGHNDFVMNVSFSPDGKTLASGSGDQTIKLWDVGNGIVIHTLSGHTDFVNCVSFTPDGKTLASGSGDKTIKLWDVEKGFLMRSYQGNLPAIISVSFSPDGKTLASGNYDWTIKFWNVKMGTDVRTLWHNSRVTSISFSPDGKKLASGSGDNTIKLWEMEKGTIIHTLLGHNNFVTCVSFSSDGKTLASGSEDQTIKLWDVEKGTVIHTFSGHTAAVTSVSFTPDGKALASGSEDETIKLWDVEKGTEIRTLSGLTAEATSISISPDGKTLASGSLDKTVKLWNKGTGWDLDALLERSCDWVRSYLENNPFVKEDDKVLCPASDDAALTLVATTQAIVPIPVIAAEAKLSMKSENLRGEATNHQLESVTPVHPGDNAESSLKSLPIKQVKQTIGSNNSKTPNPVSVVKRNFTRSLTKPRTRKSKTKSYGTLLKAKLKSSHYSLHPANGWSINKHD